MPTVGLPANVPRKRLLLAFLDGIVNLEDHGLPIREKRGGVQCGASRRRESAGVT